MNFSLFFSPFYVVEIRSVVLCYLFRKENFGASRGVIHSIKVTSLPSPTTSLQRIASCVCLNTVLSLLYWTLAAKFSDAFDTLAADDGPKP